MSLLQFIVSDETFGVFKLFQISVSLCVCFKFVGQIFALRYYRHNITEILLKVALITINETFLFWITTFFFITTYKLSYISYHVSYNTTVTKLTQLSHNWHNCHKTDNIYIVINYKHWDGILEPINLRIRVRVLNATFNNISVYIVAIKLNVRKKNLS